MNPTTHPAEPTLFYSPGACSLASHIALEETGRPYRAVETLLAGNAHKTPEYLAINPRGKVPALVVEDGVITENTAILTWIGLTHPQAGLLPTEPFAQARCISQMAWFSNTPHIQQRAKFRPYYFSDDESQHAGIRAKAEANFWANLQEIDALLAGRRWMLGEAYSVADPYALVFYHWGVANRMPVRDLTHYTRHKDRMLQRPAVQVVLAREKNPNLR